MDKFAKRRKNKDDQIDCDLAEASSTISTVKTILSQMCDEKHKTDGSQ